MLYIPHTSGDRIAMTTASVSRHLVKWLRSQGFWTTWKCSCYSPSEYISVYPEGPGSLLRIRVSNHAPNPNAVSSHFDVDVYTNVRRANAENYIELMANLSHEWGCGLPPYFDYICRGTEAYKRYAIALQKNGKRQAGARLSRVSS